MVKKYRRSALTLALLGATALGGFGASQALAANTSNSSANNSANMTTSSTTSGNSNTNDKALNESAAVQEHFTPVPDFTNLVKKVTPAVVSIDVHLKLDQTSDQSGGGQGMPQIPGFPPGFPFGFGQGGPAQPQAVEAKGSGFIINSDGIVVTNNHVVKDARTVSVQLSDGESYPAKIIGTDPKTDLAVLKIKAGHPLPYVELGSSADVTPGEWVVAMGNPFGLGGSVTAGIVSALGRDIGDGPYDKFIQIDAPINEGNSGGPLFDQQGQVIGINTAILTPSGGSVGIGFAIPSDMVKRVVTQLVAHGKVTRGFLGVSAQQITKSVAQAMGLPSGDAAHDGALVAAVSADSPANRAGLKAGDVITQVNGTKVTNPQDLADDISNVEPGHDASITYQRNGKSHQVTVAVEAMPSNPDAAFQQGGGKHGAGTVGHGALGLTLAPLTPDARNQLNLPSDASGAVITGVKPNSPADQAGLQPGDLLVGVGDTDVSNPQQAEQAVQAARKSGASALALRIVRQGQALFVGIGLGKDGGDNQG
ncbi:MAG: endopeptidase [Acidocella sp. 20-61-6]|nr:MAG: endopeptidase [Acidocella sp. 20-61-6]